MIFKSHLSFCFVIFFLFLSVSVIPFVAKGASEFDRFKKEMPKLELMEEKDFFGITRPVKGQPYGDPALAYTMRIPDGWTKADDIGSSNFILSKNLFIDIASYYGSPTIHGRSRVDVQALEFESNITAEQWYINFVVDGGYTLEGMKTHHQDKIESLMIVSEKGYTYYVRTLALINGTKIITVKYYIPSKFIKEKAGLQEQVLSTFKLLENVPRVESKTKKYRFLDIAELDYPEQWTAVAAPMRSIDVLDVNFINYASKGAKGKAGLAATNGRLFVSVISSVTSPSLIEELSVFKKKIEALGVHIGEKIDLAGVKFTYSDLMEFHITEAYNGLGSSESVIGYEFWFTVMVSGNYYYLIMLVTPSRDEYFKIWAENTQNYQAIIRKFRPLTGAFLERQ